MYALIWSDVEHERPPSCCCRDTSDKSSSYVLLLRPLSLSLSLLCAVRRREARPASGAALAPQLIRTHGKRTRLLPSIISLIKDQFRGCCRILHHGIFHVRNMLRSRLSIATDPASPPFLTTFGFTAIYIIAIIGERTLVFFF